MGKRFAELDGYEIAGCAAFDKNLITFWAQQWPVSDPLEPRPTAVFFYYADEPVEDQWAHSGIADATGIHGCAGSVPARQWVFVLDDGEVYVVGAGFDDFERKITEKKHAFFSNVKALPSGPAIAVGTRRKVFVREHADHWKPLERGLFPSGDITVLENAGFADIDGFGVDELYACGARGELWLCQNGAWSQIDLGTNADLTNICCASDGQVYITTNRREIMCGRHQTWDLISQELTTKVFESLVEFMGRVLVSTETDIYEVVSGKFVQAALVGMPPMKSMAHLATAPDVLVVAGKDEAAMFDGQNWSMILAAPP